MSGTIALNLNELNLDELEQITGGWNWKKSIFTGIVAGITGAGVGAELGGVPGAVIGGILGAGAGIANGWE